MLIYIALGVWGEDEKKFSFPGTASIIDCSILRVLLWLAMPSRTTRNPFSEKMKKGTRWVIERKKFHHSKAFNLFTAIKTGDTNLFVWRFLMRLNEIIGGGRMHNKRIVYVPAKGLNIEIKNYEPSLSSSCRLLLHLNSSSFACRFVTRLLASLFFLLIYCDVKCLLDALLL